MAREIQEETPRKSLKPSEVLRRARELDTAYGPVTRLGMVRKEILEPYRKADEFLSKAHFDLDRAIALAEKKEA